MAKGTAVATPVSSFDDDDHVINDEFTLSNARLNSIVTEVRSETPVASGSGDVAMYVSHASSQVERPTQISVGA